MHTEVYKYTHSILRLFSPNHNNINLSLVKLTYLLYKLDRLSGNVKKIFGGGNGSGKREREKKKEEIPNRGRGLGRYKRL